MTFIPFERLFDGISGGSIYLGTLFSVCAYNKWWQHLLNQERPFLGHVFIIFYQNIFNQKRPQSVWSSYDQILRIEGRNDMHWTASNLSSSMHQKSASNSLWTHLYGSIFVIRFLTIFRTHKMHKTQWKTYFLLYFGKKWKNAQNGKKHYFLMFFGQKSPKMAKMNKRWGEVSGFTLTN